MRILLKVVTVATILTASSALGGALGGFLSDKIIAANNARDSVTVRTGCAAVARLGVKAQVRDGLGRNLFGDTIPIKEACWLKGNDGRWRQTGWIVGPDVDAYPPGTTKAYETATGEVE